MSDMLYMLCSWTHNRPERRFYDILYPKPKDERYDDETLDERLARFGIKVVD